MKDRENIKVLVAEDDFFVSQEIIHMLEELGYTKIEEAANGEEAVQMVQSLHPDIVLMDIKMPKLDGLKASRLIQENSPTPVVVITAFETADLLEQASEAGISAYLTKPPTASELERAITIAIGRHRDLMEVRRLNQELEIKNRDLAAAIAEIKVLRGILPMCSFCKRIRNDRGYWEQVDRYLQDHTEADISHGLCDECMKEHYPKFYERKKGKKLD